MSIAIREDTGNSKMGVVLPKPYPRLAGHENGAGSGLAHFKRLNALVDEGYAGSLPSTELRVYLVFERHADAAGTSWPSPETIAAKLGINVRNVQRAIASLAAQGILSAGKAGSGRANILKRTITMPPPGTIQKPADDDENPAHCATFSPSDNPALDDAKTGAPW